MAEYIEIYTPEGKPTGEKEERKNIHKNNLVHHSIHIWIMNSRGEVLLTQRSHEKSNYPGMFHISVGGHIDFGEDAKSTALREAEEELDLKLNEEDLEVIDFIYNPVIINDQIDDNEWQTIFLVESDLNIDELTLDPKEVKKVFWVKIDEFLEKMQSQEYYSKFLPHSQEYYLQIAKRIIHR